MVGDRGRWPRASCSRILYANLSSAMPRAGANYVFTSRILSPFLAWLESWSFVIGLVAGAAVLIPLGLLMFNLAGSVMEIAFPDSGLWDGAVGLVLNGRLAVHQRDRCHRARVPVRHPADPALLPRADGPGLPRADHHRPDDGRRPVPLAERLPAQRRRDHRPDAGEDHQGGRLSAGGRQIPGLHGDVLVHAVRARRLPVRRVHLRRDVGRRQAGHLHLDPGRAGDRRLLADHLRRCPRPQVRGRADDVMELHLLGGR